MEKIKPLHFPPEYYHQKYLEMQKNPWDYMYEPFQVLDNIYGVGCKFVMTYLIDTGDGLILIDSGFDSVMWMILENIRKLGFDPKDIKLLLLTHGHYDHIGGARYIQELCNCKTYFPKDDYFMLTERRDLIYEYVADFRIDEFYDYDSTITLGNTTIKPILSPGHTLGSTSLIFESEFNGKKYLVGTHGGLGQNGLTKKELKENNMPEDLQQRYIDGLRRDAQLPVDVFIPSHNSYYDIFSLVEQDDGSHSVYIKPGDWKKIMERRVLMFQALLEEFGDPVIP